MNQHKGNHIAAFTLAMICGGITVAQFFIGPPTISGEFGTHGMKLWEFWNYFLGDVRNGLLFTAAALLVWGRKPLQYIMLFFADMGFSAAVILACDCDPWVTFEEKRVRWFVASMVLLAFQVLFIHTRNKQDAP